MATPSLPKLEKKPSSDRRRRTLDHDTGAEEPAAPPAANGFAEPGRPLAHPHPVKARRTLSERELEAINKIIADIDNAEKSDVEGPGFEEEYQRYLKKSRKRARESEVLEGQKRKVCYAHHFSFPKITNMESATST